MAGASHRAARREQGDTFANLYEKLHGDFGPLLRAGETCSSSMRTSALRTLQRIERALDRGTYGVERN